MFLLFPIFSISSTLNWFLHASVLEAFLLVADSNISEIFTVQLSKSPRFPPAVEKWQG